MQLHIYKDLITQHEFRYTHVTRAIPFERFSEQNDRELEWG